MKQRVKTRKASASSEQGRANVAVPNWPILILSVIGLGLAGYLTGVTWFAEKAAFCDVGADCDIVLNSRWSTLLGVPTSLWGFLTYAGLLTTCFLKRSDNRWKWSVALSLFGMLYSGYLTTISVTQLEATCPYCLTSLGLLTAIFLVTLFQIPPNNRRLSWKPWLATSLVGTVILIGGVHYVFYTGASANAATNEDLWIRGLAEHLDQAGAKFYGAYWCPACKEQKGMFGTSVKRLPYVECSISGRRGPQSGQCRAARIQSYPTWIINGRRHPGILTPSALAEYSGYVGIETPAMKLGG